MMDVFGSVDGDAQKCAQNNLLQRQLNYEGRVTYGTYQLAVNGRDTQSPSMSALQTTIVGEELRDALDQM